jgi:hypothetical protein
MKRHPFLLTCSLLALAGGVPANAQSRQVGPPLTVEDLNSFLGIAKPPTGLYLQDSQQVFGNAMNDMNNQNPWLRESNHSGFALWLWEPKAWIGAKKSEAVKRFLTYRVEDLSADDRMPVLRVVVHPDSPEYLTAYGAANANNADHVVLRSIDRTQVAQPVSVQPTTQEFWSALGARASWMGLVAVFSMSDLERIRSASRSREFFVTVVGARKKSNRDFRVKPKHFQRLGD